MTEPNIVYIGDEVRWDTDSGWVVCGDYSDISVRMKWGTTVDDSPCSAFTTPDGRQVDGFGGAKIELDTAANKWFAMIQEVPLSDMWNAESEAIEDALEAACDLYGEWVREPTEQDLKRKGLL